MSIRSSAIGLAVIVVLMGAGAAQSLTGSSTVFTDDIVDGTIRHADVKPNSLGGSRLLDNAVPGAKIADNSITGADVNEATLAIKKVHTALVHSGGQLKSGSDATGSERLATGKYDVTFAFAVGACTAVAGAAVFPTDGYNAFDASANASTNTDIEDEPNVVRVYLQTTTLVDVGFALVLTCS